MADEEHKMVRIPCKGDRLTWGDLKAAIDSLATDDTEVDYIDIIGSDRAGVEINHYPGDNRLTVL